MVAGTGVLVLGADGIQSAIDGTVARDLGTVARDLGTAVRDLRIAARELGTAVRDPDTVRRGRILGLLVLGEDILPGSVAPAVRGPATDYERTRTPPATPPRQKPV